MSRESLIEAYISALPLVAVAIVSSTDGKQCRIETGGACARAPSFYFKATHLDLVLATIDLDGWTELAPADVSALIERTAANLGAPFQTPDALRKAAEAAVTEIIDRVEAMRQNGGLAKVNAQYKAYRQVQIARAERATSYSEFLQRWTASIVRDTAASGRTI